MGYTKQEKKAINKELKKAGIGPKPVFDLINQGGSREEVDKLILELKEEKLASALPQLELLDAPAPLSIFGKSLIAQNAIDDMAFTMSLPGMIRGAIMPDGHRVSENHVPVGGVALAELIYPDIVGSDISCSVCMNIYNEPVDNNWFDNNMQTLRYVLNNFTYFGKDDNPELSKSMKLFPYFVEADKQKMETTLGQDIFDRIRKMAYQFGSSGDGNHFVEFGQTHFNPVTHRSTDKSKSFFGIMSHFGSRGAGAMVAKAFEKAALEQFDMPQGVRVAPLDPNTPLGRDYWKLMEWCGHFAEYGHYTLHRHIAEALRDRLELNFMSYRIYTRHNYAWKTDDGFLHRKGATPAGFGEMGIIPATMGHPSQIVKGAGNDEFLESASHGAGRTHSRGRALQEFGKDDTATYLRHKHGVELIGGGADEDPRAYKSIYEVMQQQDDSVSTIAEFYPKVVRMAPPRFGWRK